LLRVNQPRFRRRFEFHFRIENRPNSFPRSLLHDLDLVRRQAVEFVHELIDLPIGRVDLRLERFFVVRRFRGGDSSGASPNIQRVSW
jgi:hypothetical protein